MLSSVSLLIAFNNSIKCVPLFIFSFMHVSPSPKGVYKVQLVLCCADIFAYCRIHNIDTLFRGNNIYCHTAQPYMLHIYTYYMLENCNLQKKKMFCGDYFHPYLSSAARDHIRISGSAERSWLTCIIRKPEHLSAVPGKQLQCLPGLAKVLRALQPHSSRTWGTE